MDLIMDDNYRTNIVKLRESDGSDCKIEGHQMYAWDWTEEAHKVFGTEEFPNGMGVLPYEVQKTHPECVTAEENGFLIVDYPQLFGGE